MGVVYDWVLVWAGRFVWYICVVRWSKGEVLAWHMVWESSIEGIVNKELNYCLIIMVTLCVIVGPCCLTWFKMWSPKSVLLIITWLWALLEIVAEDNIGFQHTLHDSKTPHTELFHFFIVQCTMSLQLLVLLSFMIRKQKMGPSVLVHATQADTHDAYSLKTSHSLKEHFLPSKFTYCLDFWMP